MKERQSNFELARICAMFAIVLWHFIFHGIYESNMPETVGRDPVLLSINLFLCFGTNLFILISGFFGIKLRWQGILNLWLLTTTYNLLDTFINGPISLSNILHSFLISSTDHWFFQSYLWLMLASPIINIAIDNLNKKESLLIIISGGVLCCLSGWFLNNNNTTGHNALQLFYIYILGRYIRKYDLASRVNASNAFLIYFASCIAALIFMCIFQRRGTLMHTHHNSPFIILSSIGVFLLFSKITIQSKVINFIAQSVPAVLLISDMVFDNYIYEFIHNLSLEHGYNWQFVIRFIAAAIIIFAVSIIVDLVRRFLSIAIIPHISSKLDEWTSQLLQKK